MAERVRAGHAVERVGDPWAARRRLPAAAGHRARPPGPRRRAGAASTSGPAAGTCRWRWPRWSAATGGSTPSTATRCRATRWPGRAAAHSQVLALTQAGEDLSLPEPVDLAFCRFLLLHVLDPAVVVRMMAAAVRVRAAGWSPRSRSPSAGRIGGVALSMPDARHPDVGALLPALVRDAGLEIVDAWAEAPAGVGPGPVSALPGLPHRGRPRRRPGRPAAAGHGDRARGPSTARASTRKGGAP